MEIIRFQKRKIGYRSLVVRATSNKSNDDSSASGKKALPFIYLLCFDESHVVMLLLFMVMYQKLDLFLALFLNTSELCFSSKLMLIRNWGYVL